MSFPVGMPPARVIASPRSCSLRPSAYMLLVSTLPSAEASSASASASPPGRSPSREAPRVTGVVTTCFISLLLGGLSRRDASDPPLHRVCRARCERDEVDLRVQRIGRTRHRLDGDGVTPILRIPRIRCVDLDPS